MFLFVHFSLNPVSPHVFMSVVLMCVAPDREAVGLTN